MIEIGKIFNERYRILRPIGSGGMANVFLAEDLILHREVAIKVLRTDFQNDPIAIRRFQREAHAATELVHPNIVSVYEVGEVDGMQYLAMEYIKGSDLKQYIREHAPLANQAAVRLAREILAAITVAHEHKIVHRDLKPQNILLDDNGTVKITDFGIATAFSDTSLTQTNSMLGSVHYLSPEQARGSQATYRSDIYAIGVILFEMLTNQVPFDGDSAVAIALQHFQEEIPSVRSFNANVPQALENVVIKATAKDIDNRYSTTELMREDLATVLDASRANEPKVSFNKAVEATRTIPRPVVSQEETHDLLTNSPQANKAVDTEKAIENVKLKKKISKKTKLFVFLGSLLVLSALVLVAILTTPKDVKVPDVVGLSKLDAQESLKSHQLKSKVVKEESDTVESGKVIRTDPKKSFLVKEGRTVTLYISNGNTKIKMDDYVGSTFDDAKSDLINLRGVSASRIKEKKVSSDTVPAGNIISQTPKAGKKYNPNGDTITFTVSTGPKDFTIADYTNVDVGTAKAALIAAGLSEAQIKITYSEVTSGSENYVLSQTPPANSKVNIADGTVTLVVSKLSTVDFSSLVGATEANVLQYAKDNGVSVNSQRENSDTVAAGNVISITPTEVKAGDMITIIVSNGAKTPTPSSSTNPSSSTDPSNSTHNSSR
ncbi:MAG: Stk1 family PASTA domain-containing Ser/Thr kinase [Streptococcaceae bacterium]|jgi:serine/threonine-protein kinase|nr:Stk1 family PASTA domain-containing Ser/Thr kinase [Streptococcaceae bacterium]